MTQPVGFGGTFCGWIGPRAPANGWRTSTPWLAATVALLARPWPNRAIMARCIALAGLVVGVDAVAG